MDYLERAKLLGHDVEALKKGETITSTVTVNSLEEFKKIFSSDITDEQRKIFSETMTNVAEAADNTLHLHPLMMNLMHHIHGDRAATKEDKDYAAKLFPVKIEVISGQNIKIDKNIVKGPGAAPYAINADTLIFDGGSVTAITTSLAIQAKNLVIKAGGSQQYHVGIIGAQGQTGTPGLPQSVPNPAANGTNTSAPSPGICTGAGKGGNGTPGSATGLKGNTGGIGDSGQANLPANIVIKTYDDSSITPFVVFTQSGAGGKGGSGGKGGTGQTGGNGGNGCDSGCEGTDGGNGGKAGDGGPGGTGGPGGNGTDGHTIMIAFPNASKSMLQTISKPAPAGDGGDGGDGGDPGSPGSGGSGGKHASNGVAGGGGSPGSRGEQGSAGSKIGAPGNISINYT